jgi:hypothetical protein
LEALPRYLLPVDITPNGTSETMPAGDGREPAAAPFDCCRPPVRLE